MSLLSLSLQPSYEILFFFWNGWIKVQRHLELDKTRADPRISLDFIQRKIHEKFHFFPLFSFFLVSNTHKYFLFSYTSERPSTWGWSINFIMAISRSTFISTDSDNFSRLMILIATFLPNTQWTPSLTNPETSNNMVINSIDYFFINIINSNYID